MNIMYDMYDVSEETKEKSRIEIKKVLEKCKTTDDILKKENKNLKKINLIKYQLSRYSSEIFIEDFAKNIDYKIKKDSTEGLSFFVACKLLKLKPKTKEVKEWYKKVEEYLKN